MRQIRLVPWFCGLILALSCSGEPADRSSAHRSPRPGGDAAGDGCRNGELDVGETDVDCGGPSCRGCREGGSCQQDNDCLSNVCSVARLCLPSACGNHTQDTGETGVDCGGACPACFGERCTDDVECVTNYCRQGSCDEPTCTDGVSNGDETGVDCGGPGCPRCAVGQHCLAPSDCISSFCHEGSCATPTCDDRVVNQNETDTDCGGVCPGCDVGQICGSHADCASGRCTDYLCAEVPPTCDDGEKNGDETDIDCGGVDCLPCASGKYCEVHGDCYSETCIYGLCRDPTCLDGVRNQGETGTDCGGPCTGCGDGLPCEINDDCQSARCTSATCTSCADEARNGSETDVDCGGDCPACADGEGCLADEDCTSGHCGIEDLCISCTTDEHVCARACVSDLSTDTCGDSCMPCPDVPNAVPTCDGATCGYQCLTDFHVCGDACVSNSDPASCGQSCTPCPTVANGTPTCDAAACGIACNSGYHACDNSCVSNLSPASCNDSCTPCPAPAHSTATCDGTSCDFICIAGYHRCGNQCLSDSSPDSCGAACTPCPSSPAGGASTCVDGECGFTCLQGSTLQFAAAPAQAVGGYPQGLAAADFDLDDANDLVVAHFLQTSSLTTILYGAGDGTFSLSELTFGTFMGDVVALDFDRDGSQDFVLLKRGCLGCYGSLYFYRNLGDGSFEAQRAVRVGRTPPRVLPLPLADSDLPALVTADATETLDGPNQGSVSVLVDPSADTSSVQYAVGQTPIDLAVEDFDQDGSFDVVTADSDDGALTLLAGNGDGTFGNSTTLAVGDGVTTVGAGDFDGDTLPDLVVGFDNGTMTTYPGNGDMSFGAASAITSTSTYKANEIVVEDLDGDRVTDIAVGGSGGVYIFHGNGDGSFAQTHRLTPAGIIRLTAASLDGDHALDLAGIRAAEVRAWLAVCE